MKSKRSFSITNGNGTKTWIDRKNDLVVKASFASLGLIPHVWTNYTSRNPYILSDINGRGDRAVLFPNHTSEVDPIWMAQYVCRSTGQIPYQIGKSSIPSFLEIYGLIRITRPKEVNGRKANPQEAREKRELVYEAVMPGLLREGEIFVVYPQGGISENGSKMPVNHWAVTNVIEAAKKSERKVYGIPLRIQYSSPMIKCKLGNLPLNIPKIGGSIELEARRPILLNDKGYREVVCHLEKELSGLVKVG